MKILIDILVFVSLVLIFELNAYIITDSNKYLEVRSFNGPSVFVSRSEADLLKRRYHSYDYSDNQAQSNNYNDYQQPGRNSYNKQPGRYSNNKQPGRYSNNKQPGRNSYNDQSTNNQQSSKYISESCLAAFKSKALDQTNFYRRKHHVNDLTMNENTAASVSSAYASKLSNSFSFSHNPGLDSLNLGENLYQKMSSSLTLSDYDCQQYAIEAIDAFYNEISSYDFNSGSSIDGKMIGHFTQLVWKDSQDVGFGLAVSSSPNPSDGMYYLTVVCNYSPPGNFRGEYVQNVLPA